MSEETARRRRKPAERQAALSMRIAPATRDELVQKAHQHGRSTTQEADRLLQQGLLMEKLIGGSTQVALNVATQFHAHGEARARELGAEGDWTRNPECYKSAAHAAFRQLLELSPPPWDGQFWHLMFSNVLANVQYRRTGWPPGGSSYTPEGERFQADEQGSKP